MKYKVIVYYDNMPDSEHIFNKKLSMAVDATVWMEEIDD